jgi:predicted nucleic acid-binding protein
LILVVDASAMVDVLCGYSPGAAAADAIRQATRIVAPAHLDAEVFQALARMQPAGVLEDIEPHLVALGQLGLERFPVAPLLVPAHRIAGRVAAKDALYVALALSVGGHLLTTDERLRRAVEGIVPLA